MENGESVCGVFNEFVAGREAGGKKFKKIPKSKISKIDWVYIEFIMICRRPGRRAETNPKFSKSGWEGGKLSKISNCYYNNRPAGRVGGFRPAYF